MKKLLVLGIFGLLLSSCQVKHEKPRMYVKCWETWHDRVLYSGWTDGHGVGMGQAVNHDAFITFTDEQGDKIVIDLNQRICAIAADWE